MLKWLIVVALSVLVLGFFAPKLTKLGLGRLPGDLRFRYKGRDVYVPITSTILISAALTLLMRLLRI
jgi:Protein of unknown function (DUF2905)